MSTSRVRLVFLVEAKPVQPMISSEPPGPVNSSRPVSLHASREIAVPGDSSEVPLRHGADLIGELVEEIRCVLEKAASLAEPWQWIGAVGELESLLWGQELVLTVLGLDRIAEEAKWIPPPVGFRNGTQDPTFLDAFWSLVFSRALWNSHPQGAVRRLDFQNVFRKVFQSPSLCVPGSRAFKPDTPVTVLEPVAPVTA